MGADFAPLGSFGGDRYKHFIVPESHMLETHSPFVVHDSPMFLTHVFVPSTSGSAHLPLAHCVLPTQGCPTAAAHVPPPLQALPSTAVHDIPMPNTGSSAYLGSKSHVPSDPTMSHAAQAPSQASTQHTASTQNPDSQSPPVLHFLAFWHFPQCAPPQSASVSSPFCCASSHRAQAF